jgi:ADP-dependent phosphofructokinase/glucokinase
MKIELKESIGSREDLLSCLLFCMKQGSGAEILIENEAVARQIEGAFSWKYRLGGNAGIMANVLAALGAQPVLNASAMGPRLSGMISSGVIVPSAGTAESARGVGETIADHAREKTRDLDEKGDLDQETEMVHFVFQFKKGDTILSGQSRITAPSDNRFIATYDVVNTRLLTSRHFDNYCLENIQNFDGILLSGFHLAPLKGYQDIFSQKIAQIKSWKDKNPQIFIHAEMGSFQSPGIMQSLLLLLPKIPVDSLGLNEDELVSAVGLGGGPSPNSWPETMQAAERLRKRLGLFRVAVHTRDYILSVMLQGKITAQEETFALRCGVEAAAALAATGLVTGEHPEEIKPLGLKAKEEFCCKGAIECGRGAFLQTGDEILSLVPSLVVRKPKITVGLGDTATATMLFQELSCIRKNQI